MAGKVRKQIKQGGWLSVIALTSLFVSVFTLFYIFRHSVQFNLWGVAEWLMFWQLTVVSVTAVIALGTIFINKKTSKQKATLDVILNDYQDAQFVEADNHISPYIRGTAVDDNNARIDLYEIYQNKGGQWEKERGHLLTVINRHEFYACAINSGVLDEDLFKRLHCTNFIKLWNAVSPLVMKIREEERKDTIFRELEILVALWKANPLKASDL